MARRWRRGRWYEWIELWIGMVFVRPPEESYNCWKIMASVRLFWKQKQPRATTDRKLLPFWKKMTVDLSKAVGLCYV